MCSLATWDLRYNMNMTSASVPHGVDEFPIGDLTAAPCRLVKPPRVKESPAALECKHWKTVELPPLAARRRIRATAVVFGQVVGIHIDDRFVKDGMVDTGAMRPIARLGYMDYAVVTPETMFSIDRPTRRGGDGQIEAQGRGVTWRVRPSGSWHHRTMFHVKQSRRSAGLSRG